ncbi:Squalene cyclase, C-terminal [Dillenia turbinata]|uniref:Squalene cyclase, C-terminal n=1 Tax=Dillenia turbinata TaxID=194707 RepID=A0AAN8W243_9MAGN
MGMQEIEGICDYKLSLLINPTETFGDIIIDYPYGSWAVCFTYGTWFGIKGLVAAGRNFNSCSTIRKACDFLLSKQLPSGGWGESYLSSQNKSIEKMENSRCANMRTTNTL